MFLALPPFFATTNTIQANVCPAPLKTELRSPEADVTTAQQTAVVSGTTYANSSVAISDNGHPLVTVTSDAGGSFYATIALMPGDNSLKLHVTNICDDTDDVSRQLTYQAPVSAVPTQASAPAEMTQLPAAAAAWPVLNGNDQLPPSADNPPNDALTLVLTAPHSPGQTTANSVFVSGRTNRPAVITITVNGHIAATYSIASLSFKLKIPLELGSNVIAAQATDGQSAADGSLLIERQASTEAALPANPGTASSTTAATARHWYKTIPGQVAIAGGSVLTLSGIIYVVRFL